MKKKNKGQPLLVGITGGIGAGKSTVAKVFSLLSVPIYSADDRAKWLMSNDPLLQEGIVQAFGEEAYTDEGILNRTFLAERVFADLKQTETINNLIHPAVRRDFKGWANEQKSHYVLKEAALLFETGSYKELYKTINVSAPLVLRISRVMQRDPHRSRNQIQEIINRQLPDAEKNKLADYVIKNSDSQMIIPQVLAIHGELMSL